MQVWHSKIATYVNYCEHAFVISKSLFVTIARVNSARRKGIYGMWWLVCGAVIAFVISKHQNLSENDSSERFDFHFRPDQKLF